MPRNTPYILDISPAWIRGNEVFALIFCLSSTADREREPERDSYENERGGRSERYRDPDSEDIDEHPKRKPAKEEHVKTRGHEELKLVGIITVPWNKQSYIVELPTEVNT